MKKKGWYALCAIIVIAFAAAMGLWLTRFEKQAGVKEIEIIVVDRTKSAQEEVWRQRYRSDAQTLSELLEEQSDLHVQIEQSTYGSLLTEICGLRQNMESGPWLVFESENNASCKEYGGMCPAMDEVSVQDGDSFTFALISSFS